MLQLICLLECLSQWARCSRDVQNIALNMPIDLHTDAMDPRQVSAVTAGGSAVRFRLRLL